MTDICYSTQEFWDKKVSISYILAIMVFFIHNSSYGQYTYGEDTISTAVRMIGGIFPALAQVAVPLFMIIAGVLFFRNYEQNLYFQKLKKRAKTLLIPYLTWNTLAMLVSIFATLFLAKYFIGRQPFEFSVESVLKSIFCYDQNGQFWFIADLLIYILLSPVLYVLIPNKLVWGGVSTSHHCSAYCRSFSRMAFV